MTKCSKCTSIAYGESSESLFKSGLCTGCQVKVLEEEINMLRLANESIIAQEQISRGECNNLRRKINQMEKEFQNAAVAEKF